jgi:hypothetical protein
LIDTALGNPIAIFVIDSMTVKVKRPRRKPFLFVSHFKPPYGLVVFKIRQRAFAIISAKIAIAAVAGTFTAIA